MKAFKKTIIILTLILAAAGSVSGLCYLRSKPVFYRFFYPFDRITGTISVMVNGETYELKSDDVIGQFDFEDAVKVKTRKDGEALRASLHGGKHGPYSLTIRIDGLPAPIQVILYQVNRWNVTRFDLDISIDSAAKTISFTSLATINDVEENRSAAVAFSDEPYVFYIVSV